MTNREFENYLTLVSRLLRLKRGQSEQIAGELRDHLELRVAELIEDGFDANDATRMALEEFGDAASLAGQFQFISETYQRRWVMRFATLGTAALFLMAILVMAMWPTQSRFGSPDSSVAGESSFGTTARVGRLVAADDVEMSDLTRRTAMAREILLQEIDINFEEVEFRGVMDFLSDKCGLPFILDMSARDDSLAEDEPINFRITGIPLNKALRLMLMDHNATFLIQDGVVRIISLDVASDSDYFVRRIFDVSDLLAKIKTEPTRGGGSFGGGAGLEGHAEGAGSGAETSQSVNQGTTCRRTADLKAESLLTDTIKKTVDNQSWDETNGEGTMEILGGLLIVVQTEKTNESVEEMLQDLTYLFAKREQTMND